MQRINVYLRADSVNAKLVDSYNQTTSDVPAITRGLRALLVLKMLNSDGTPMTTLEDFSNWEFVLATDWLSTTNPQIRVSSGIIVSGNEVSIPLLETNTEELIEELSNQEKITIGAELVGFESGETDPSFLVQFNMQVRNRRGDSGTGSPAPVTDGNYSSAQIDALLNAGFEVEFSVDGETWTDNEDAQYFHFRNAKVGGEWSPAVKLVTGPQGSRSTINIGTVTTGAPDTTVTVKNVGDENDAIFNFSIPQGIQGEVGTTPTFAIGEIETLAPNSEVVVSMDQDDTHYSINMAIPKGTTGDASYLYVAYAAQSDGQGFSLTPTESLKYRAEIISPVVIDNLTVSHFVNAVWQKYIGDDQTVYGDILVADNENSISQVSRIVFENATIREGIDGEVIINFKDADFVSNAELNAFAVLNGQTKLSAWTNGGGSPTGNIGTNIVTIYSIPEFINIENYSTLKG